MLQHCHLICFSCLSRINKTRREPTIQVIMTLPVYEQNDATLLSNIIALIMVTLSIFWKLNCTILLLGLSTDELETGVHLPVKSRGSTHCVPQPLEQHLVVPLQARSELHSKSHEVDVAGTRYGHWPTFLGKPAMTISCASFIN